MENNIDEIDLNMKKSLKEQEVMRKIGIEL